MVMMVEENGFELAGGWARREKRRQIAFLGIGGRYEVLVE